MYWLMSADAIARIGLAIAILFVIVPTVAWPRRPGVSFLEQLFWNLGVGITLITLCGQVLSLANLFSLLTLIPLVALVILARRARHRGLSLWMYIRQTSESVVLALLNIFDGKVNVPRRIRRRFRRSVASLREKTASPSVRIRIAAWTALTLVAAALRLYRPLASANLGFSDTYVHLYLLKLLEEGRQVDPDWGPYPRGMHFLLLIIQRLTNVDDILLMNYFGAFVGILMTLGVAESARRLSQSLPAGLFAGFLFATLVGGPGQYFILGGAVSTSDESLGRSFRTLSYGELAARGEFDIALTAFHRQTSTLSQELAIALLFPAAMFLLSFLRNGRRWHLVGFGGSTAAIAAVHSGVVVPLVVISAIASLAVLIDRTAVARGIRRAAAWGAVSVVIGSTWALAVIVYPYAGGASHISGESSVGTAALYYFPFLRGDNIAVAERVFVSLTPALFVCVLLSIGLLISAAVRRGERRGNLIWTALVFLTFVTMHFASMLRLPQLVETMRNSQWLLISMTVLAGVAAGEIVNVLQRVPRPRMATAAAAVVVVVLWTSRVPLLSNPVVRDRIVNYSGYGTSALAVLRIERSLEPYTWTLVSYGQEFPMVLKRGFHLPAADFLSQYDPAESVVPIPTRHVFIIVEKTPHRFQIDEWSRRFSRAEIEQRLQTWVHLYQATHTNMRVFIEDENVRVYHIERTQPELDAASRQASR